MFSLSKLLVFLAIGIVILLIFRTINSMQAAPKKKRKKKGASAQRIAQGEALVACAKCGVFKQQGRACPDCGAR